MLMETAGKNGNVGIVKEEINFLKIRLEFNEKTTLHICAFTAFSI